LFLGGGKTLNMVEVLGGNFENLGGSLGIFENFYIQKHSCRVSSDIRGGGSEIYCPRALHSVSKIIENV